MLGDRIKGLGFWVKLLQDVVPQQPRWIIVNEEENAIPYVV